jgi:hypothetical protein
VARRRDTGLHNGWVNRPPRRQMTAHDRGYQGSERPLKPYFPFREPPCIKTRGRPWV